MRLKDIGFVNVFQRIILLIADLHVGTQYAIWPRNYYTREGNLIGLNTLQEELLERWEEMIQIAKNYKVDTVYVIGDCFAGINPIEKGTRLLTLDMTEQVNACADLLENLCKELQNPKILIWLGSPYHMLKNIRLHKMLVTELKARGIRAFYKGELSNLRVVKEPRERILHVCHEATSALVYPETALGRDIMFFLEGYARGKLPRIHAIIKAHRHKFEHIHSRGIHSVQVPCWTAWIPYKKSMRWYPKFQPDIGFVILAIDKDARLRFIPWIWVAPKLIDEVVDEIVESKEIPSTD